MEIFLKLLPPLPSTSCATFGKLPLVQSKLDASSMGGSSQHFKMSRKYIVHIDVINPMLPIW